MIAIIFVLLFLTISAQKPYRGGEIRTLDSFLYGRFETRMKPANANGTVQSLFLFWDGPDWQESEWNEIDVEIVPSAVPHGFSSTLHYGDGKSHLSD